MFNIKKILKRLVLFHEPIYSEGFVLEESMRGAEGKGEDGKRESVYKGGEKGEVPLKGNNPSHSEEGGREKKQEKKSDISKILSENLQYIKKKYTIPDNGDIVLREFDIVVKDRIIPAFIVFIDGMTDRKVINDNILQPMMLLSNLDIKGDEKEVAEFVKNHILPHNQAKVVRSHEDIIEEVNFGGCGIYIDGIEEGFAADVKGWEHRGVDKPSTELVIRGPQEGFNEQIRANTALVRRRLKDEDLIVENIAVGNRSKTPCALMYIKDIANDSLVSEVRRRLKNINIDYLLDSGELEQLLEDNTFLPAPQIIATERPDRVSSMLTEGKVAVIVNGSPFVLVMPATMVSLMHSSEDSFIRFPYGSFLRIIRIIGITFALILPGAYIAITNYHQEMIPTDLLFSIGAAREKVPFPSIIEILIMEIAFELIREAGIRIPGAIGPTLGIIGALILGQAAVAANIVSPILIIIVAVTGLGSFSIPNFSLALAFRILRFGYILLGSMAGFLGIAAGIFIHGLFFVNAKSFGVPFLVPFGPRTFSAWTDELLRGPIWRQEKRPDFLNTKDENKQPGISRKWLKRTNKTGKKEGGKND